MNEKIKMKNHKKASLRVRKLMILLLALMQLALPAEAFGATENYEIKLTPVRLSDNFSMWHYSGGYWKVGDNECSWTFTDKQVGAAVNIGGVLSANTEAVFRYTFPDSLLALNEQGASVNISVGTDSIKYSSILNKSSFRFSYSKPDVEIRFRPVFNLSKLRTFDDYVSGLNVSLPLVDVQYGENLYAIYSGGSPLGMSEGAFRDSSPSYVESPYMHPSLISGSSGKLKPGFTVNTESGTMSSNNLYVGWGTFKQGGAMGLYFYFPIKLTITVKGTREVADKTENKDTADKTTENASDNSSENGKDSGESSQNNGGSGQDSSGGSGQGGSGTGQDSSGGGSGSGQGSSGGGTGEQSSGENGGGSSGNNGNNSGEENQNNNDKWVLHRVY